MASSVGSNLRGAFWVRRCAHPTRKQILERSRKAPYHSSIRASNTVVKRDELNRAEHGGMHMLPHPMCALPPGPNTRQNTEREKRAHSQSRVGRSVRTTKNRAAVVVSPYTRRRRAALLRDGEPRDRWLCACGSERLIIVSIPCDAIL